jgi:hypothetical protein
MFQQYTEREYIISLLINSTTKQKLKSTEENFYCQTAKEAEEAGFRRAFRYKCGKN